MNDRTRINWLCAQTCIGRLRLPLGRIVRDNRDAIDRCMLAAYQEQLIAQERGTYLSTHCTQA